VEIDILEEHGQIFSALSELRGVTTQATTLKTAAE
jgi:hypothetical protein